MHGTKILVRGKEKFEIWRFKTEREILIGINGNIPGVDKTVRVRERFEIQVVQEIKHPLYLLLSSMMEM